MVFSSLTFLFVFLPLVVILYYLVRNRTYRNLILFVSSIFFYAWGEPVYVILMFISIANDYLHALLVDYFRQKGMPRASLVSLISSLVVNLGLLAFFKYSDFMIGNYNTLFNTDIPLKNIALPIGISFYTFQTMSYTIDVYFDKVKVQKNILTLATYVALFPQLIAGPIVRYATIEHELEHRKEKLADVADGIRRFLLGLGKKVIIANQVAIVADLMFGMDPSELSIGMAWIGIIAYTFQIYFDFSGYSDMAIGLGKIFGFHFLENFNYPYIASSITDFWRRWHISLGTWFRDYVYIPLGGNRVKHYRWFINIFIVWFLTGLWHGAEWNFVLWGLYFGVILVLEKLFLLKVLEKIGPFRYVYTLFLVLIGWVIFRAESFEHISGYVNAMFNGYALIDLNTVRSQNIIYLWPYFTLAFIGSFPLVNNVFQKMNKLAFINIIYDVYLFGIFAVSIILLVSNTYNPFIYFRF